MELSLKDILLEHLKKISEKIDSLESHYRASEKDTHRSHEAKDLFTALAKAQGEMSILMTNKINPYFGIKYADLRHMIRESRAPLAHNGLAVIQQIVAGNDGQSSLNTILTHESGQWIKSTVRITPAKNDIKTIESYTNFMKRLAYGSMVGIVSEGEDDDGEIEMANAREIVAKGPSNKYDPKRESFEAITKEQLEELEYELSEYPDIGESVLDGLRILSLADMPKSQFMKSVQRIREIKDARNNSRKPTR